jgi:hypothetical protein
MILRKVGKSRCFKMPIEAKGFFDLAISHNHEAYRVCVAEILIRVFRQEFPGYQISMPDRNGMIWQVASDFWVIF